MYQSINRQNGNTLMEVMAATAVVSTLITQGLSFFNTNIAKAQATQALQAANLVLNQVTHVYASGSLKCSPQGLFNQGITEYVPQQNQKSSIASAKWHSDCSNGRADSGYISVTLSEQGNSSLRDQFVVYFFETSSNKSFLSYTGCRTTVDGGSGDGEPMADGVMSPIIADCEVDSGLAGELGL